MRLIARGVNHAYGGQSVLSDVSFEVASGESVAIVGPSGSGKSTLLAILGGLERPQAGTVTFETGIPGPPSETVDAAWILQTTNALGNRTVFDNVALGTYSRGLADAWPTVEETIAAVGLQERIHARAKTLSGGELQRVSIARALVAKAPFILADEPTGQLDRSTTHQIVDLLFSALDEAALVVATHDPLVADRCDRVFNLVDGRIA